MFISTLTNDFHIANTGKKRRRFSDRSTRAWEHMNALQIEEDTQLTQQLHLLPKKTRKDKAKQNKTQHMNNANTGVIPLNKVLHGVQCCAVCRPRNKSTQGAKADLVKVPRVLHFLPYSMTSSNLQQWMECCRRCCSHQNFMQLVQGSA